MDSTVINHVGIKTEEHPIQIEPWSFLHNVQYGMVGHINPTITELEVTRIKTKTNEELDIQSPSASLIHDREKTYFCNNYGKQFTSPFQNHLFTHTRNSTEIDNVEIKIEEYPIQIEPWSFQPIIEKVMVAHFNSSITLELDVYKNETQTTEKLDNHSPCTARIHDGRKAYYCNHCGKNFTTNTLLRKHLFIHTRDKKLQKCSLSFKSNAKHNLFKIYQRMHTGEKPSQCSHCDKAFSLKSNLVKHKIIHTEEKPFQCSHRDKSFAKKGNLVYHQRRPKPYNCNHCDKAFFSNTSLIEHQSTHTGEKSFQCSHCDKAFSLKSNLVQHQIVHTGGNPFQCTHCDKSFARKNNLVFHQRKHTGEKPYNCNHQDKSFAKKGNLVSHQRRPKPYNCNHCDKAFISNSSLVDHQRTHTGEKPFQCTHCDKLFAKKGNLVLHQRIHTGEKPFQCSHCDKAFSLKANLDRHHMLTHNVKK